MQPGQMDPLEQYIFDTAGVLIRKQAIPAVEIAKAKAEISNHIDRGVWKFPTLNLGTLFWDWLIRPVLIQPAIQMCGDYTRLDHAFGVSGSKQSQAPAQLHGGPDSSQSSCFYHNTGGRVGLVGQLSVGICLTGQDDQTGGFCYLPGSHKAFDRADGKEIYLKMFNQNLNHPAVVVPKLEPGDLIFFSESLVHGDTGQRTVLNNRLMAYYKFTPGWMCWRDPAQQKSYASWAAQAAISYSKTDADMLRCLIEPPWTGKFDDTQGFLSPKNTRRPPVQDSSK